MEKSAIKKFHQLCKSYFLDHLGNDVSPVTVNAKQIQLRSNVLPVVGNKFPYDVNGEDVYEIVSSMRKQNVSERYIRSTIKTGSAVCDYGIELGIMEFNPFKNNKIRFYEDDKFVPFDPEEMEMIKDIIGRGKYKNLYFFILESGFMRQEALGLYWDDINFETGEVTVQRRYISENGNFVLKEYPQASRPVRISEEALKYLNRERLSEKYRKNQAKERWNEASNFVFTDEYGYPLRPETPTNEINRLSREYHFSKLTLRNLRNQYLAEHKE